MSKINYQIKEINPSPNITKYRNKMIVGFRFINNEIIAGFYEENSHKVIALDNCLMHSDVQNKIVLETVKIMKQLKKEISKFSNYFLIYFKKINYLQEQIKFMILGWILEKVGLF